MKTPFFLEDIERIAETDPRDVFAQSFGVRACCITACWIDGGEWTTVFVQHSRLVVGELKDHVPSSLRAPMDGLV